MKIAEISTLPKTPEQQRIDTLKTAKDRAADALTAERQRQQVSRAQKTLAAARQPKPINQSFRDQVSCYTTLQSINHQSGGF